MTREQALSTQRSPTFIGTLSQPGGCGTGVSPVECGTGVPPVECGTGVPPVNCAADVPLVACAVPPAGQVILCEQQRENVFTIGPAWAGAAGSDAPMFVSWETPVACFSLHSARNVIAAWQRKTGIADVVFVPSCLRVEMEAACSPRGLAAVK